MKKNTKKPSAEAKALSLYLMAFKSKKPSYKEQAKRINKQWDRVQAHQLDIEEYKKEVQQMLDSHGGYQKVVEDTVWFYVKKTGEWNLKGDDQYCIDAQKIADQIAEGRKK